jgi:indole-3-glycerol phosphate synthase
MGTINPHAGVLKTTRGYVQAGASGLSILTDEHYFGGSLSHLLEAREANACPILQKDFVMDRYQVIEAKAYGADAILLIAAMLPAERIKELSAFAASLEMETLFEIHEKKELDKLCEHIQLIGINNRNLSNFKVNQSHAFELIDALPEDLVKIAESGIQSPNQAFKLLNNGFDGLLIGGEFMRHARPEDACQDFIEGLKNQKKQDKRSAS